jgi:diguanylate cyclase (GGDEF)-like protein
VSGHPPTNDRTGRQPSGPRSGPARLLPVVLPVAIVGWGAAVLAGANLAGQAATPGFVAGALALLVAAAIAEAYPVPVEGVSAGGVSLAAAFLVGAALIYDWQTATLLALLARGTIEVIQRRPFVRLVYNGAVYALSGAAAGGLITAVGSSDSPLSLLGAVSAGSFAFYAVNISLVALVVARSTGAGFEQVLRQSVRWTAVPFALMGSVSLILAVLWERSPVMAVGLVGPLVAVALYQRSVHGRLEALRLAMTDPVTSLGNHRAFQEQLATAAATGAPFTLCLLDLDELKQINDRFGHQAGDAVLAQVAGRLQTVGDAFRLGGDEFAMLLPGRAPAESMATARMLVEEIGRERTAVGEAVTVSAGLAAFPRHGQDPHALFAAADAALYRSKNGGKNQVQLFDRRLVRLDAVWEARETALLRAARRLAEIVDTADALREGEPPREGEVEEGHSRRVAELAARIATRLGLEPKQAELVRLAAQLHDLGKLAIPGEILNKSSDLVEHDWLVLREHPETGRRILRAIGGGQIADWVFHHHERWDGMGYPSGLKGEEIPLGARIIFVADAFDAITSPRPYRPAATTAEALAEIRRCAGSQFDPAVVDALVAELPVKPEQLAPVA